MLDLCNYAVTQAEKLGATEAEAFIQDLTSIEVTAELGEISKVSKKQEKGIFVRLVKNKALGFSYTTNLTKIASKMLQKGLSRLRRAGRRMKIGFLFLREEVILSLVYGMKKFLTLNQENLWKL